MASRKIANMAARYREQAERIAQRDAEEAARGQAVLDAAKAEDQRQTWLRRACTASDGRVHEKALAFALDPAQARIAVAGRQSGKTWIVFCLLVSYALFRPGAQCLYLSFSAAAVQRTTWNTLRRVLRAYGIGEDVAKPDAQHGRVQFANGSTIYALGSHTEDYVENFRGATLDIAVVDEAGATPSNRLRPLVDEVLAYALRVSRGPLLIIGTPPRKRIGWFAEQWFGIDKGYTRHTWTGEDNPFVPDFHGFLAAEAKRRGVDWRTDPTMQRENFCKWVDDVSFSVVPAFDPARNAWTPGPGALEEIPDGFMVRLEDRQPVGLPAGNWTFAMGIDPGSRDRLAVEVLGWGDRSDNVYQVAEWVAPRNKQNPTSVLAARVRAFEERFGEMAKYVDTSHNALNDLAKDYQMSAIQAARKVDRPGQLARVNDLASLGRLMVVNGSALFEDLIRTEWDESYRETRVYSRAWHPDALDAFRYGLARYWNEAQPPDPKTKEQRTKEAWEDTSEQEAEDPDMTKELDRAMG